MQSIMDNGDKEADIRKFGTLGCVSDLAMIKD